MGPITNQATHTGRARGRLRPHYHKYHHQHIGLLQCHLQLTGAPHLITIKTVAVDWHIPTTFSPTSWRDVKFVNVLTVFCILYFINVARKKFLRSIDMRQATQPSKHFYFKSFRLPRACIVASLIELGVARPPIIKWLLYKHLSCVWEELEGLFPPRVLITRGKKKFFHIIPKGASWMYQL
jgi:hypothetical protein